MSNDITPDFIQKLLDKIDLLTAVISEQTVTINKLTETITSQQQEIAKLKEQLGKNSNMSLALNGVIEQIDENGVVQGVSYGTGVGNDLDYYRGVEQCPMHYGQSMVLIMLVEALKHE